MKKEKLEKDELKEEETNEMKEEEENKLKEDVKEHIEDEEKKEVNTNSKRAFFKNTKKFNLFSKILKTAKSKLIFVIVLVAIVVSIISVVKITNNKSKADFTYLNQLLEKSSELTSAKLTLTGIEEFKDAGAMIINKSDFLMVYTATIRAGVELKDVDISSNDLTKEIIITMPKAKVFDSHVNQDNIKYYDEKFALFNVNSKEDANKACALAEKDAITEAEKTGILEFAETEAEYVIKSILSPAIPKGYSLTIKK